MKKIVLSIAGVMAAAAFAPEASALPAFARQTGMACNACHAQHFPVLNGFGRAFKAAGYTMMGAQEKVEAEHLSIPDTLNAAILFKGRYQKTNGQDAANVAATSTGGRPTNTVVSGSTTNSGQWQIPDELGLFFGGRVGENIGFLMENSLVGGGLGGGTMGIIAGLKMPFVFDMGGAKLSVIPFVTDVLGPGYGYEESSNGIVAGVRWSEHRTDISAAQYIGFRHATGGLSLVAKNDMGYINVTRYSPNFAFAGGTTGTQMRSNWIRIAATPNVADWDMHIGAGFASGSNFTASAAGALFTTVNTKATLLDFQAQGSVGGKELSIYSTYGSAPGSTGVAGTANNFYNAGTLTRSAFTIGADYSIIPHALHLGAAYRNAKTGVANAAGANQTDNSITVQAIYDMTQNVALHLVHSKRSGSAYDIGGANGPAAAGAAWNGTSLTTFMLEAAW